MANKKQVNLAETIQEMTVQELTSFIRENLDEDSVKSLSAA